MILTVLLLLGGVDGGHGAGDEPVRQQKGGATAWGASLSEDERGRFAKRHEIGGASGRESGERSVVA